MESPSVFFDCTVPSLSSKLCGNNFRRIRRTEDSCSFPIPGLSADILHMRVKEGSKIRNLLRFVTSRMHEGEKQLGESTVKQVVFTGSGRGVTKTITCVEILKRTMGGLHQVSKLYYKTVNEIWESPHQEASHITLQKTVPAICILLSKDPLDPQEPGYQPPLPLKKEAEDSTLYSQPKAKRVCLNWSRPTCTS